MNFASDNNAGTHPKILEAINSANVGYAHAYGDDDWREKANDIAKFMFGNNAELFHVFGGTPANVLAIEPLLDKYGALLCSDEAHVWRDEAGAPERNLGNKLYSVETVAGKITPEAIKTTLTQFEDAHQPLPQAITITQPTELGTVYRLEELQAVSAVAKANNLKLHIDGARICNAAAFLKCSLGDIVNASGASSLSLGMTKNGGMFGENIVFFKPDLAENFLFRRRNLMQVQSKMRFISAQFNAFFENDLWREIAEHANSMAQSLHSKLERVSTTLPVETNSIFAQIEPRVTKKLLESAYFYEFRPEQNLVRWMTSWQTTSKEVEEFANLINDLT